MKKEAVEVAKEDEDERKTKPFTISIASKGKKRREKGEREIALSLSLSSLFSVMAASGGAAMMPLRALPATGGTANAKTNAALAKRNNSLFPNSSSAASAARRAAMLLLASPEVVAHGGEELLLTVARLLRGVAARGRDLGGGSAEWAYDLLPVSASMPTPTTTGKVADAEDAAAEKQRRASSCAAAASSGRAVAEAWKSASGALIERMQAERAGKKAHSFLSFSLFLSSSSSFLPASIADSPDVF